MLTPNRISLRYRLSTLGIVLISIGVAIAVPGQNAAQTGREVISIESFAKTDVPLDLKTANYVVEVAYDVSRGQETFPEDWLVLRIKDQKQQVVATKTFHSSYQKFHIDIVDLDGDDRKEFVFSLGHGRGTSARQETLYIERFEDSQFKLVAATPLSDFYASGRRWWYSVEFKDTDGNGTTDVELRLHKEKDSATDTEAAILPSDQTKIFKWRKAGEAGTKIGSKKFDAVFLSAPKSRALTLDTR